MIISAPIALASHKVGTGKNVTSHPSVKEKLGKVIDSSRFFSQLNGNFSEISNKSHVFGIHTYLFKSDQFIFEIHEYSFSVTTAAVSNEAP